MTNCGVAHYFARPRVQRRIERQRPVSVLLEAVSFGAPWRQRQDRVQPIQLPRTYGLSPEITEGKSMATRSR
jgi:hypothetical protein